MEQTKKRDYSKDKVYTVRVTPEECDRVDALCKDWKMSRSDTIRQAIRYMPFRKAKETELRAQKIGREHNQMLVQEIAKLTDTVNVFQSMLLKMVNYLTVLHGGTKTEFVNDFIDKIDGVAVDAEKILRLMYS